MFDSIFVMIGALLVKHWIVDFVNQSQIEVESKGIYGNWIGIGHSVKHGIGTAIVMAIANIDINVCLMLGFIDGFIHYHVDWIKMRFGARDMMTKRFWIEFGLDQLVHGLTYVMLIWLLV